MKRVLVSKSERETKRFAKRLLQRIIKTKTKMEGALILALSGELGAGKTVFVKGLAGELGVKKSVLSPTFVLIKRYPISHKTKKGFFKNFYHIDCYRIKKAEEIAKLEWKKLIKNPENIIVVEWAEKIHKILPKKHIAIHFQHKNRTERAVTIINPHV